MDSGGGLANVLYIDLSSKEYTIVPRPDLFARAIGGSGVAAELLAEECPAGCDPLAPENPVILAVGPLTGLFPLASKTVAMFKSPLTGNLGESHCGGRSAVAVRMAGYGAMVIRGRSSVPVYLAVHGDRVFFRNASVLWGVASSFTAGRLMREREEGAGIRSIMRIGRAGEKLVAYAGVMTETYRHFGRLGLGAVFGAKQLKGIVVSGKRTLKIGDHQSYRQVYDEIFQAAVASPVMKKYHELGTAENVMPLNRLSALPARNLQQASFSRAEEISGERLLRDYLGRRLACAHCPVACIHIAALREPYEEEPYFYKTTMISYDYELIYAMGSMLGIGTAADLLKLIEKVEILGLDTISTGVCLAWATEALEKGIIQAAPTTLLPLEFGKAGPYLQAIQYIVDQPNDFYRSLARGVDHAAAVYGGREFALAFGGNEMPGYHTGPAAYAGFMTGARHSHLDNAGYAVDQGDLMEQAPAPEKVAEKIVGEEGWRQVLSSLAVCFFGRGVYTPDAVEKCLAAASVPLKKERFAEWGLACLRKKYEFKVREGFSFADLRIPGRILQTPAPAQGLDEPYLRAIVSHVQKLIQG